MTHLHLPLGIDKEVGGPVLMIKCARDRVATAPLSTLAPHALRRLLIHWLDNPLKFSGAAERVVSAEASGNFSIKVLDRGPGISVDELSEVLKLFSRVERSRNRDTGGSGGGCAQNACCLTLAIKNSGFSQRYSHNDSYIKKRTSSIREKKMSPITHKSRDYSSVIHPMRRISRMNNRFSDTLLINVRIINNTPHQLNRVEGTHNGREGSFPPQFSANAIDLFQFQASPHLKGDILIEYGVKKPFFETQFNYRMGEDILYFETSFLYAYEKSYLHQSPRVNYYWTHSVTGPGKCSSRLRRHSTIFPYNYAVDFIIE